MTLQVGPLFSATRRVKSSHVFRSVLRPCLSTATMKKSRQRLGECSYSRAFFWLLFAHALHGVQVAGVGLEPDVQRVQSSHTPHRGPETLQQPGAQRLCLQVFCIRHLTEMQEKAVQMRLDLFMKGQPFKDYLATKVLVASVLGF